MILIYLLNNRVNVVMKLNSRSLGYQDWGHRKRKEGGREDREREKGRKELYIYQVPDMILSIFNLHKNPMKKLLSFSH